MKDIKEVYPQKGDEEYSYFSHSDYTPLLESFGYSIVLKIDDSDYQGDSRLIFQDGTRYGLLIFGWGSCSGCDSLQACDTYEDIEELRQRLSNNITWYDTPTALLDYLNTHDWEGDYSWHDEETQQFITQAKALMEERGKHEHDTINYTESSMGRTSTDRESTT